MMFRRTAAAGCARPAAATGDRSLVLGAILLVLGLRLAHLAFAAQAPTTYQLGPDEQFYLLFARTVAAGGDTLTPDFVFMDPLFGYALGAFMRLFGENLFLVLLLQALADTLTAWIVYRIGAELGEPRAGLLAMLLYGICGTALLYAATLLRETWVALYLALYAWSGLVVARSRGPWAWLAFGVFCGVGVALRSNIVLLGVAAVVLLPLLARSADGAEPPRRLRYAALLGAGLAAVIVPLGLRNVAAGGSWSPLPTNGGPVLHHIYNAENPGAYSIFPRFIAYAEPVEMWRGYRDEAQRRTGRAMTPTDVGAYWSGEAARYVREHPWQTLRNLVRKSGEFVAWPEIGNNRSLADERMFSPLLRWLPSPSGWLVALGVAGLLVIRRDRRSAWLWLVPLFCLATFAVFYAESRFRYVAMPVLAVGAGLFLTRAWRAVRERSRRELYVPAIAAVVLGAASVALGAVAPAPQPDRIRIGWGYARLGDVARARDAAQAGLAQHPAKAHELLGYLASMEKQPLDAIAHYRLALDGAGATRHVVWYNLALALAQTAQWDAAIDSARRAAELSDAGDYWQLWTDLLIVRGRADEAQAIAQAHPALRAVAMPTHAAAAARLQRFNVPADTAADAR